MAVTRTGGFTRTVYAARFFYGGWFLFHGLNWWLGYFPEKSFAPDAHGLIPELIRLHVFTLVKAMEVAIGIALLLDLYAPLAIVAAFPITIVIAALNVSKLSPFGIGVGVTIIALNVLMAIGQLDRYLPMLAARGGPPSTAGLRAWRAGMPAPPLGSATLPPSRQLIAAALGIAAAAAFTYASIHFAAAPGGATGAVRPPSSPPR